MAFSKWPGVRHVHAMGRAMRRRLGQLFLWLVFVVSIVVALKATSDRLFEGTNLAGIFAPFPTGNQLAFDLAIGMLTSLVIYVLIVWVPEQNKRRRIRQNLLHEYDRFKEDCILQLLFASETPAELDFADSLKDMRTFRAFFKANGPRGGERWYDVMNGLESQHIRAIRIALGVLAEEVRFTVASVDVADDEVFQFLKRLNRAIAHHREAPEDEDVRYLTQFLWEILAGWSTTTGYQDNDFVTERFARI